MIPVPDVVNQSQRNAEIELENQGLKVGQPEYINSNIASITWSGRSLPLTGKFLRAPSTSVYKQRPGGNSTVVGKYTGINESVALELIKGDNLEIGNVYRA